VGDGGETQHRGGGPCRGEREPPGGMGWGAPHNPTPPGLPTAGERTLGWLEGSVAAEGQGCGLGGHWGPCAAGRRAPLSGGTWGARAGEGESTRDPFAAVLRAVAAERDAGAFVGRAAPSRDAAEKPSRPLMLMLSSVSLLCIISS